MDIALFPIPECVTFPGTVLPLHVFEPRYRAMVQYCTQQNVLMAVCHTQKEIHPAKALQDPQEALQSNQATYKPYPVFSAGPCELVQTLEDGRMLINVHIEERYRSVEAVQLLPFSIYKCEVYADDPQQVQDLEAAELLRQKILRRLLAITAADEIAQHVLGSASWMNKTVSEFSFEIMSVLQLDASIKQKVLETRSPHERLNMLFHTINS